MTFKLRPLKSNQNEVETERFIVLFSYETPVACYDKVTNEYYRTTKKWSTTTSKHINQWLREFGNNAEFKEQDFFDNLLC